MSDFGAFLIAIAIAFGLYDVASAIRHANITMNFSAPMQITTASEADDGPR